MIHINLLRSHRAIEDSALQPSLHNTRFRRNINLLFVHRHSNKHSFQPTKLEKDYDNKDANKRKIQIIIQFRLKRYVKKGVTMERRAGVNDEGNGALSFAMFCAVCEDTCI